MNKIKNTIKKLEFCIKKLHLPGIKEFYVKITEDAVKDGLSYNEYLLSLLEIECQIRGNNRVQRLLKESKIPDGKRLDNFDMKRLPLKVNQQIKSLLDGDFLNRAENILIFGNPGSGKTHLVCGLCRELINQNKRILFTTSSLLVQELLVAKKNLLLNKILKKFSRYNAIIIDDIGYVQQEREEMEVLFTLLADRYERSSIIITSNLPFSKWDQIFKDTMITAAAIDRLVHHSVIIEMNLKSYRMEKAKKTKKGGDKK